MFEIPKKSTRADRIRRILDISIALVALIVFSPLILLISCVILISPVDRYYSAKCGSAGTGVIFVF